MGCSDGWALLRKFPVLLLRLKQKNINLHFILLCETFLRDNNSSLFNIPGYAFLSQNRKTKSRGGVALYIRNDMKYKRRTDIELNVEGEFESIFAEIMGNPKNTIIGQIYRVPNTNETQSIERYRTIIDKISHLNLDWHSGHWPKFQPFEYRHASENVRTIQYIYYSLINPRHHKANQSCTYHKHINR